MRVICWSRWALVRSFIRKLLEYRRNCRHRIIVSSLKYNNPTFSKRKQNKNKQSRWDEIARNPLHARDQPSTVHPATSRVPAAGRDQSRKSLEIDDAVPGQVQNTVHPGTKLVAPTTSPVVAGDAGHPRIPRPDRHTHRTAREGGPLRCLRKGS